jgi:hypothetical protein
MHVTWGTAIRAANAANEERNSFLSEAASAISSIVRHTRQAPLRRRMLLVKPEQQRLIRLLCLRAITLSVVAIEAATASHAQLQSFDSLQGLQPDQTAAGIGVVRRRSRASCATARPLPCFNNDDGRPPATMTARGTVDPAKRISSPLRPLDARLRHLRRPAERRRPAPAAKLTGSQVLRATHAMAQCGPAKVRCFEGLRCLRRN